MNIAHDVVVDGVQLRINTAHTTLVRGAERMEVEVFQGCELVSAQRKISKPTGHFVTDDGMVDTAEPCNCGPNAACSNCPTSEATTATAASALTAVYAAIEKEVDGYDNAGVLSGLADLVNALMSASVTEGRA